MSARLGAVQAGIAGWLDATAPAPVRVVSACAGDGRDLLGVLAARPDAARVHARLVEYDATLADRARRAAAGLTAEVDVVTGDAAAARVYRGAVPADLVLLCGVFGNIGDADIARTIAAVPQLCAPGARVIWTRGRCGGRFDTDLTPRVRRWFADAGFREVAWTAPEDAGWSVGVHDLAVDPVPLDSTGHWFTFVV